MFVGYDNTMLLSRMNSIVSEQLPDGPEMPPSSLGMAAWSDVNNLLYEDPSLVYETLDPGSGDPVIRWQYTVSFPSAVQTTAFGLYNWANLNDYDRLHLEAGATSTGPWFNSVTFDLSPIGRAVSHSLLIHQQGGQVQNWRVWFEKDSGPRPALSIGSLFFGTGLELSMNPDTGGIRQSRIRTQRGRRALGGALHVARSVQQPTTSAQFSWSRMDDTLLNQLNDIDVLHGDKLIAIIPPNQVGREIPLGFSHFLGRSLNVDVTAKHGATPTTHASRVIWTLEGAI
jgi:hypothetical protein